MKTSYDVVVVGGGPAGSMAAWEAANGGSSVCILEKDRDIGYPLDVVKLQAKQELNNLWK